MQVGIRLLVVFKVLTGVGSVASGTMPENQVLLRRR